LATRLPTSLSAFHGWTGPVVLSTGYFGGRRLPRVRHVDLSVSQKPTAAMYQIFV
jgi:hypothetical protein